MASMNTAELTVGWFDLLRYFTVNREFDLSVEGERILRFKRLSNQLAGTAEQRGFDPTPLMDIGSNCLLGVDGIVEPPDSACGRAHVLVRRLQKERGDGFQPDDTTLWSKVNTPQKWAKRLGLGSGKLFVKACVEGKLRHRKFSDRRYQLDMRDVPADA